MWLLDIFGSPYAFKNSSINFFFLSIESPLWFLSLFFRSEKCPSMAFVVFGMFNPGLSYHVKSQGRFVFRLRYALRSFLWIYLFFPFESNFLSFRKSSHLLYQSANPPSKLSLSVLAMSSTWSHNSILACIFGFLVKYRRIIAT